QKLEANDNRHLADWLARQRRQKNHSSFWGFVKWVAVSKAIDYARMHPRNIAKRVVRRKGEPRQPERFEWVREEWVDSQLLGEVLDDPRSVLPCGGEQELEDVLAEFQRRLTDDELALELAPDDSRRALGNQAENMLR